MSELLSGDVLYRKRRFNPFNVVLNVVIVIFLIIICWEIYFGSTYIGVYVTGTSMLPTLTGAESMYEAGGDYVYANRRGKPNYGSIVIVVNDKDGFDKRDIIKRAVAFGGDTVKMEYGVLYLKKSGEEDFKKVEENYLSKDNVSPEKTVNSFEEHTVAENCMFLLGDNRDVSSDSRQNGDFHVSKLIGVVPNWAMNMKKFTTSFYTFFSF